MKRDLSALTETTFDLLIVGGGVHGASAAWDAAQRGLSVALIERGDFGQETSANSLKTMHGGLRYLQDADFGLVRSMIHERSAWLRIAPHLVHPLPCIMPTYRKLMKSRLVMSAAVRLNDLMGYDRNAEITPDKSLPASRVVSREQCLEILPGLPADEVTGGVIWYDGQVYNSERLTLSLIKSAEEAGAVAANYVEAVGLLRERDRVRGMTARDKLAGTDLSIRSQVVLNAAGPWVDNVLNGVEKPGEEKFHHSFAINLVTRKLIEHYGVGLTSRPAGLSRNGEPARPRLLFISPWQEYSIVGTLHDHFEGNPDEFEPGEVDIQYLIDEANSAYPEFGLTRGDVCFVHRGLLPEKHGHKHGPVELIREGQVFDHRQGEGVAGLISMVGVKFTSARKVAEKAVDSVFSQLGRTSPGCMSDRAPLTDAPSGRFDEYLAKAARESPAYLGAPLIEHLVRSYGSEYPDLVRLIPPPRSGGILNAQSPEIIAAQARFAVQHEMAHKLT
ncbi:MAG TPA: glycerol-3-phosphate dehydrogenase/oxidase, partial [Anaerolineales bacterium]|nr:glycerol-3-phosphate dehydrogenase/oxidase [Anaerolineales bacterium]